MYLDALVIAQAVHNNGGIVMMQVQKMVKKATLHPKSVRIPGYLVDIVVVDADQTQLYGGEALPTVLVWSLARKAAPMTSC